MALLLIGLLAAAIGAPVSSEVRQAPKSSICEINKAGPRLNGMAVHLQAILVVDSLGGELRDKRCPSVTLGFADDGNAERTDLYSSFSNSFDRDLFTRGRARQEIELHGVVESPGAAGAGRPYRSVIKLVKIVRFSRIP
ncbi:MAG: hypothetical protein Q8Q88_15665 [Phenylobacterium sp.]|uniref:hypothetical protein n=1 Tax=Phenylobacterium sp. TaxID=1871053 RepID=UPI002732FAE4|nr:hypothetical protein [Phenylobacterium sp.]MDP3748476.1 hypothetical protein [Phenylobacterium sp.]